MICLTASPNHYKTWSGGGPNEVLVEAVDKGDVTSARKALAEGADANSKDEAEQSLLAKAAKKNDVEMVRSLLDAGANIELGYRDNSPLYLALSQESLDAARLLIERGANVNARLSSDQVESDCLEAAASAGSAEMIALLIDRGAKYDRPSKYQETRLHKRGVPSFWLPLGYGTEDVNARDLEGNTPKRSSYGSQRVAAMDPDG